MSSTAESASVRLKKGKLVCGVGINDADYVVYRFDVSKGKRRQVGVCPFYEAWANMLMRSYSAAYQKRNPSYSGCSVDGSWHRFMAFREWMQRQDYVGKHLDKDILFPGNKVYSAETAVFVDPKLNLFLGDRALARGEHPAGVRLIKETGTFEARCNNPFTGVRETLGRYPTPGDAFQAWKRRKHELACEWADRQSDPRVAKALRLRFA